MPDQCRQLQRFPVHLGPGARAQVLPEFTGGMDWYKAYGAAHGGDGAEGRLVSWHRFSESWRGWEMHPAGDEVVACIEGAITLVLEAADGSVREVLLEPGGYAIVPAGVWHTANVAAPCAAIFITSGMGTQGRAR